MSQNENALVTSIKYYKSSQCDSMAPKKKNTNKKKKPNRAQEKKEEKKNKVEKI